MMENLFNKHYLQDFINDYRKKLNEDIDSLEITDSTNTEDIISNLKSRATIHPINIREPKPSEPRETTRQRQNDWGESYSQKVYEIYVTIPFDGNKDLFYCMPYSSTVVYLDKGVNITSNHISAKIVLTELDSTKFNSEVNGIIGTLKTNLPQIHSEIKLWNDSLDSFIRQSIEKRKGVVSKKHSFMEQIGLKINPISDDYLTPNPIIKKKIPQPVSETSATKKELIPILQESVYKDIKEVIYNTGQAIERKPSLYIDKYEEDLRDVFLLFLETRYESTTGVGEAFNKKGKTDILLKYAKDGTNLFVAECKFWKGKKSFLNAIDQLFGYLTHRDSKTALIMFVDQKELTTVMETAKKEIENHPQYKEHVIDNYNTSISYKMTLPDDSKKSIQMEVMFFHFPK
tara:strand:+ start:2013 stop:3218 length:1206 start_codon:yes stop_codon:yes gene_type:complete